MTGSYIFNPFLARGLLIALMMEAASTSEMSVKILLDYKTLQPRRQPSLMIY
jgi:hypothetical protein